MAKPDFTEEELAQYIDEGYISKRKHPHHPLWILNYTPKTAHEWLWVKATRQCRGLIIDKNFNIVSHPFEKFFSLDQITDWQKPNGPVEITAKMDGSLGITYWIDNKVQVATRGSFESEQAIWASEFINKKEFEGYKLNPDYTYLFEIIYPENRIVVDYKGKEMLVLLAIIETETGKEIPLENQWPTIVEKFSELSFVEAMQRNEPNFEGYVCKFLSNGERIKVKNDWYKKHSYLIRELNPFSFLKYLKKGEFNNFVERYYNQEKWVEKEFMDIHSFLSGKYYPIENYCKWTLKAIKALVGHSEVDGTYNRKELAKYIKKTEYPRIIFGMLDNKDVWCDIWREVENKLKEERKTNDLLHC